MAWSDRRREALQNCASATIAEIAKRYKPPTVEAALRGKQGGMDPSDYELLRGAQYELEGSDDRLQDVSFTHLGKLLDGILGKASAAQLANLSPREPEHVTVEPIEATLPADPTAKPVQPAQSPIEPLKPNFSPLIVGNSAAAAMARQATPHDHAWDADHRCTVCRLVCIHAKVDVGKCVQCGLTIAPSSCPGHAWLGNPPTCKRCGTPA